MLSIFTPPFEYKSENNKKDYRDEETAKAKSPTIQLRYELINDNSIFIVFIHKCIWNRTIGKLRKYNTKTNKQAYNTIYEQSNQP